jgi:hypothetical protein
MNLQQVQHTAARRRILQVRQVSDVPVEHLRRSGEEKRAPIVRREE